MAKDVLITPATGNVEFKLDSITKASLSLDDSNNLVLSSVDGDISVGSPGTDVYIGDGVNNVDIIFEENGAVRALTGKTLTLGAAGSFLSLAANITSSANITGNITGGNLLPPSDNTGVVGTAALTWNSGQFTNLVVDGTLSVRAAIDLADNDILRFGSSDDWEFFHNGTSNYMDLNVGDLIIRDNTTTRFTFGRTTGNLTAANFLGVASSAKYADLAEIYTSDHEYTPGTVVVFGGSQEITVSTEYAQTSVAGVISTAPAYLMNSAADGQPVALTGRAPCRAVGHIRKGDLLTSSATPGVATRLDPAKYLPGCVIGKALQDYHSEQPGTIEIAVGVK